MTKIITPPDLVDEDIPSIMLVSVSQETLELVIAAVRVMRRDINIYLSRSEEDVEWFGQAARRSHRLFRDSSFEEIHKYLKDIDV